MSISKFFGWAFLFFVLLPFLTYEALRLRLLYDECIQLHVENELLLKSESCNSENRRRFAKKDVMCREAEEEQKLEPASCTWRRFWQEGEVLRVWNMFTRSHWMLWGTLIPLVCFLIFMLFASRNQRLRDERMLSFQERMYKDTLSMIGTTTGGGIQENGIRMLRETPVAPRKYVELVPGNGKRNKQLISNATRE